MPDKNPVAIIGMGCLFPKSTGLKNYWKLLYHGKDAITEIPESHWSPDDYFDPDPKTPDHVYCKRGGFLDPIAFDPSEFGIPPSALEATDTSQLLGLLVAKRALEDCGYGDDREFDRDRTSVILGVTGTQELVIPLSSRLGHPRWRKALAESNVDPEKADQIIQKISDSYIAWQENSFPGLLGNVVAGRISNRLDLRGTNCVVDAACASSLSAVHLAILELISGRSDMVVTGGVDTLNDIFMHMCFSKTQTLSATGDVRPFSKDADGTVLGEGIGILVLKRLEEAQRDGNRIYAVIKGIGSSSDGKSQSIYSPNVDGQLKALRAAYKNAGINPSTVGLIEAHGTGTRVGDKVEFTALNRIFHESGANGHKCALGSVKSMIGHTKAAAGAAGVIKAALGLYHKVLPPTLKAETPDPSLDIESSHFYLNSSTRPWFSANGHPRRAGVSAFGFGGSNFHIVLEEYNPIKTEISWDGKVDIIAFSADRKEELIDRIEKFSNDVASGLAEDLFHAKAAESRQNFSFEHSHRLLMVYEDDADKSDLFSRALKALGTENGTASPKMKNIYIGGSVKPGKLAFVFPGQGSQYPDMGRDYICTFPQAMKILELADKKFKNSTHLTDLIFPTRTHTTEERQRQEAALKRTDIAQPAIGAVSLAMLKVLQKFAIKPDATCGHSFGELTALCGAGWIDEETMLDLSITRGHLMAAAGENENVPEGAMLAVQAPLDELEALVKNSGSKIVIANRNSPDQGVLSGPVSAVVDVEKICREKKIHSVRLPVSTAFHSELVKDAVQPFLDALKQVRMSPTAVKVFSNSSAEAYPADPHEARTLLGNHLARPVEFVDEIENLFKSGVRTFVEIGPKSVLTGLISAILEGRNFSAVALDMSRGQSHGLADLAGLLCRLAASGYPVALSEWGSASSSPRKPRMNVLLSGTNYSGKGIKGKDRKSAETDSKPMDAGQKAESSPDRAPVRQQHPSSLNDPNNRIHSNEFQMKERNNKPPETLPQRNPGHLEPAKSTQPPKTTMSKEDNKQADFVLDALKVVSQGLQSMQHLQAETARAHQRFLDAQTEANRTLQEMMKNTRRLAERSLGILPETSQAPSISQSPPEPTRPMPRRPESIPAQVGDNFTEGPVTRLTLNDREISPGPFTEKFPVGAANGYTKVTANIASKAESPDLSGVNRNVIEKTMLEVVSQLTGYPVEMLGLDMDIEAELGIDSIKRVEILSAVEEKMPDLPPVSPEIMGTMKTLGQIADYLAASDDGRAADGQTAGPNRSASEAVAEKTSGSGNRQQKEIVATMLEVVSQLTGYPVEMLGLDMDIEAELGIDSIKRVEILSAVEEKMPDLPPVSPEIMGTMKTLGQIAEYLAASDDGRAADGQSAGPNRSASEAVAEKTSGSGNRQQKEIVATMLEVVSQLTGYPVEMLGLDMDIEAELGIDSIKRVEILSAVEEKMPDLPPVSPEIMGTMKTLGQIADYLGGPKYPVDVPDATVEAQVTGSAPAADDESPATILSGRSKSDAEMVKIPRKVVSVAEAPIVSGAAIAISGNKKVFVTEDNTGLSGNIAEELTKLGINSAVIPLETTAAENLVSEAAGLVIVQDPESQKMAQDLKTAFAFAKRFSSTLLDSANEGGALFATVTRLDGAFGLKGRKMGHPIQGGLAGLAKTAAVEWENVCCHAIDIAENGVDYREVARAVAMEILTRGPVEIGLDSGRRYTVTLESRSYPEGDLNLTSGDVVVISGGARGITAAAAQTLAGCADPCMVLLGRSPEPVAEPPWLSSLEDEAAMKKALLEHRFKGQTSPLAEIERAFKACMANREISHNLAALKAAGVDVHYYSVDVRDFEAVRTTLDAIRINHGNIAAIIHGAGILEDRLIADKTPEQFERVFDTKVGGLENLLQATSEDDLKYLVIFSSVAARFGNKGQVDYAMANEALNKIAQAESFKKAGCRVISINWGPWDSGMVTPGLRREFERRGIHLIPTDEGTRCLVHEMSAGDNAAVEVVIGAEIARDSRDIRKELRRPTLVKSPPVTKKRQFELCFEREIDITRYPILNSHIIDNKPVVPLAVMMEWFAHGALHQNPGLILNGLNNIQLLKGIRLNHDKHDIRLFAGKLKKKGEFYEVAVELRGEEKPGHEVIHSRAGAILSDRLVPAPPYQFSKAMVAGAYTRKIKDIYEEILFHGSQLRGIRKIVSCSPRGMVAHISAAPAPREWFSAPLRDRWIADPLVMDCAFQMAILWCFEKKGIVALPTYAASYRQYRHQFPTDGVKVVLEADEAGSHKIRGDFTFLDSNDEIVASLTGFEAIMDATLLKAFKPRYRALA